MQTKQPESGTQRLGDAIATAFEVSNTVASDGTTAGALAARHLERVLVRGGNARLATALRNLARELAPARARERGDEALHTNHESSKSPIASLGRELARRSAAVKGSLVLTLEHVA